MRAKKATALGVGMLALSSSVALASVAVPQVPLNPNDIPQFIDPLPKAEKLDGTKALTIRIREVTTQILPEFNSGGNPTGFGPTAVFGYNGQYPGPTIEAERGTRTRVKYRVQLPSYGNSLVQKLLTVDQTLHWADPLGLGLAMGVTCTVPPATGDDPHCFDYQGPLPTVPHLHGGETPSQFDGGPDAWWTRNGIQGPDYFSIGNPAPNEAIYRYRNAQEGATLWYHDHALGITRLNVYGGLSGFYLLRDPLHDPANLPGSMDDDSDDSSDNSSDDNRADLEREILIQDRMFDTNAQLYFPDGSNTSPPDPMAPPNPDVHPFWIPEFVGNTIVANGKSWPYLEVDPRRYRFRLLNGSNARHYNLKICSNRNFCTNPARQMWVIGTDGGFLDEPMAMDEILLAPGERVDVIVDFDGPRQPRLYLVNNAPIPFGGMVGAAGGFPVDNTELRTVGRIMEFRLTRNRPRADRSCDPSLPQIDPKACVLRGAGNPLVMLPDAPDLTRQLTLNEVVSATGPLELLLNNTRWGGRKRSDGEPIPGSVLFRDEYVTELPQVGATEVWEWINISADTHPIHLHLVQFQLLERIPLVPGCYEAAYAAAFGGTVAEGDGPPMPYNIPNADGALGGNPPVSDCLAGPATGPAASEAGWKDTVRANPGDLTRVVVRFAPTDVPVGGVSPGENLYPFNPTGGGNRPGYVWHCHILDHEDNEMMRPMIVRRNSQ